MRTALLALLLVAALAASPALAERAPKARAWAESVGVRLLQVQVLMRHGDRTPFSSIATDPVTWICPSASLAFPVPQVAESMASPGRLHAIRYLPGLQTLPGNCSAGQLTQIGQTQQQTLGAMLGERYVSDLQLLPSQLEPAMMFVRSSETPRCLESAQELLGGLYPFADGVDVADVVSIYTVDAAVDSMQLNGDLCPALDEALLETLYENRTFIEHILEYLAPVTPAILKAFNTTDPLQGLLNYDTLVCLQAHGLPWPKGINQVVFDFLTDAYNQFGTAAWKSGAFAMGPFFQTLLNNMQVVVSSGGLVDPRFMLFSGHDTSVGPTLSALGVYEGLWPPYASHVYFELYQNVSDADQFFVQVLYQDLDVIPTGCANSLCPIETFAASLGRSIPADYSEACKLKDPLVHRRSGLAAQMLRR